jgi:hypothetical protein
MTLYKANDTTYVLAQGADTYKPRTIDVKVSGTTYAIYVNATNYAANVYSIAAASTAYWKSVSSGAVTFNNNATDISADVYLYGAQKIITTSTSYPAFDSNNMPGSSIAAGTYYVPAGINLYQIGSATSASILKVDTNNTVTPAAATTTELSSKNLKDAAGTKGTYLPIVAGHDYELSDALTVTLGTGVKGTYDTADDLSAGTYYVVSGKQITFNKVSTTYTAQALIDATTNAHAKSGNLITGAQTINADVDIELATKISLQYSSGAKVGASYNYKGGTITVDPDSSDADFWFLTGLKDVNVAVKTENDKLVDSANANIEADDVVITEVHQSTGADSVKSWALVTVGTSALTFNAKT